MIFIYYLIIFISLSLTSTSYAQHKHVIPITASTIINSQPPQTKETIQHKPIKQTKKVSRHARIKRICIYTGCAIGAVLGTIFFVNFVLPIATFGLIMGLAMIGNNQRRL